MNRFRTIPRFGIPYGPGEVFAALRAMAAHRVPPPEAFHQLLGDRPMFWSGSGRQSLWLILKALGLKPEAAVATPLYADGSVAAAIREAGLRPLFVDIDPVTLTMDPEALARARNKASAVVVLHFFGHVALMPELLDAARGIPVVEDTAHSPLSFLDGRMTGTFGAACFYSFASTKYWPAGGGGMATLNDTDLTPKMEEWARHLGVPRLIAECRDLLLQMAKTAVFSRKLYGLLGRPLRGRAERRGFLEPRLNGLGIQPGHAAVALRQAAKLPAMVERHRENSLRLLSLLGDTHGVQWPWERRGVRYNYHLFPVVLGSQEERDAVMAGMLARHVETSRIYFNIVELSRRLGYAGGCPAAEAAATRVLTLPNYAALEADDIEHVARAFLLALHAHRARSRAAWSSDFNRLQTKIP